MSFWDFLPTLITVGATIYGAKQASKSNDKAAQQATQASKAATNAQVAGLNQAREELAVNRQAASPGLLATQEVISRGAALTPQQQQAVADSRQQTLNSIKGSSLRGSARATSAMVADTDTRVRNAFMDQNQARADNAAQNLSQQYFGAGNNMANTAAQTGSAVSRGLIDAGNIAASNTIGQGTLRGQAIGDIGAVIAQQAKDQIRDTSYGKYGGGVTKLDNGDQIDWYRN